MQLSEKAKKELRAVLEHDFGDNAKRFSDEDINDLGVRLLKLTRLVVKRKLKPVKQIATKTYTKNDLVVKGCL